jgi:uncharacterized protein YrrD
MSEAPEFIKQSELLEQLVLDRATMDELGRVEVLWSYPKVHRVLGFICKTGFLDRRKMAFNLDQLEKLGSNGILVNSAPVETDRDRVQHLETLLGCEVWSDEGDKVGRITDYLFHLKTGSIRHYLMASSGLQGLSGKTYALYPSQILGIGRGRVMVSAGILPGLELYQEGLDRRLERRIKQVSEKANELLNEKANDLLTSDRLADEKAQLGQSLQSLVAKAKTVGAQVKGKAQDLAQEFLEDVGKPDRRDEWEQENDRDRDPYRDRDESRDDDEYEDDFDFDEWDQEVRQRQAQQRQAEQRQARSPQTEPNSRPPVPPSSQSSSQSAQQSSQPRADRFYAKPAPPEASPTEPQPASRWDEEEEDAWI